MKRTKYYTRSNGLGVCLWRVTVKGVRVYGNVTKDWRSSLCSGGNLQKVSSIIQVTHEQARKWYPIAFRPAVFANA